MKLSDLKTSEEVLEEHLQDPEFRELWEKTALARAISLKLVGYRAEHDLSQRDLAKILGMKQPQVARLEYGDVTPSLETLARLSERLSLEILLDFRPSDATPKLVTKRAQTTDMLASYRSREATVLVAAS